MQVVASCFDCTHFHRGRVRPGEVSTCDAFPDGKSGIPLEIFDTHGEFFGHQKPYPGDHGIQFEARPKSRAFRGKA